MGGTGAGVRGKGMKKGKGLAIKAAEKRHKAAEWLKRSTTAKLPKKGELPKGAQSRALRKWRAGRET